MNYTILRGASKDPNTAVSDLEALVNKAIEEGWRPIGGTSQSSSGNLGSDLFAFIVLQAMIKER